MHKYSTSGAMHQGRRQLLAMAKLSTCEVRRKLLRMMTIWRDSCIYIYTTYPFDVVGYTPVPLGGHCRRRCPVQTSTWSRGQVTR